MIYANLTGSTEVLTTVAWNSHGSNGCRNLAQCNLSSIDRRGWGATNQLTPIAYLEKHAQGSLARGSDGMVPVGTITRVVTYVAFRSHQSLYTPPATKVRGQE